MPKKLRRKTNPKHKCTHPYRHNNTDMNRWGQLIHCFVFLSTEPIWEHRAELHHALFPVCPKLPFNGSGMRVRCRVCTEMEKEPELVNHTNEKIPGSFKSLWLQRVPDVVAMHWMKLLIVDTDSKTKTLVTQAMFETSTHMMTRICTR